MALPPGPGYCYCIARRRYSAVELRLRKTGYELTLTLAAFGPGLVANINNQRMTAAEALKQIERGQHYLHATDPQIHRSIPPDDPVAARLLEVAALRSRADV
jgi:hypothetical protein